MRDSSSQNNFSVVETDEEINEVNHGMDVYIPELQLSHSIDMSYGKIIVSTRRSSVSSPLDRSPNSIDFLSSNNPLSSMDSSSYEAHFRPIRSQDAPIFHLGGDSFCCFHEPGCRFFSHPEDLLTLCSVEHTSRCFCSCMTPYQIDKSFILEMQERGLYIDAYRLLNSIASHYAEFYSGGESNIEDDLHFRDLIFRYESCFHFYRILAEVDCHNSSSFYFNLLELENQLTTCHQETISTRSSSRESVPNDHTEDHDNTPCRNNDTRSDLSRFSIFNHFRRLKFPNAPLASVAPTGTFGQRKETINNPNKKEINLIKKYVKKKDESTVGHDIVNIPSVKWNKLADEDLSYRAWCKIIPNSTVLLFRLEGVIETSLMDVLSVMAEVDLTIDWAPFVTFPFR